MDRAVSVGVAIVIGLLGAAVGANAAGPRVGEVAPAFALPASTGGTVRLADFAGNRHVVLAFYIKDFTPG